MQNRAIITVLDSINPTTMPYNEFILYRNSHYKTEKQILLLTGSEINIPENNIPSNLEIHKVGKNPIKICFELKHIISQCKRNNLKYVIHLHSIRGTFSTILAMLMGKITTKQTIYTIHSSFYGFKIHNKILTCFNSVLSNYVTCVSETSYNYFPKIIRKIKSNKMITVQNGVNTERIDKTLSTFIRETNDCSVYLVYIARIIPIKNHKFLIKVLKQCPENVKFIFIGSEDKDYSIRKYAQNQGVLNRIEFTGLIPREEVYKKVANSDVYISSSTLEGLPVSALEAMYCGLPIILSNIPQHKEISKVCPSVNILPLDVDIWVNMIKKYASTTKQERIREGLICKESAYKFFSLKKMHENFDKIYQKIW